MEGNGWVQVTVGDEGQVLGPPWKLRRPVWRSPLNGVMGFPNV